MNKNTYTSTNQTPPLRGGREGLLVVLGAAESGVGAAYLAQQQGYDVFVSDFGAIADHINSSFKTGISGSKKTSILKQKY